MMEASPRDGRTPGAPAGFRLLAAVLAAVLLASLAVFAHRNLPYSGLWYDEAVQFWISRGVDPFTAPGTPDGGLLAVARINGRANLDPGGFSLLLHAWTGWAFAPAWLRALPLGFFLVGLGAIAGLGWAWRRCALFALLGAALPLGYPLLLDHAVEVRPYAMEFAGVAVACLFLHHVAVRPTAGRLAVLSATLAAFMTSRYSYTIFAGAVCLALARTLWPRAGGKGRARLRSLLAFGGPLLVGLMLVGLGLWLQRRRITYQGGALLDYLAPATAAGKPIGRLAAALAWNLLSPVAIPVTLAAVVALLPERWRARCPGSLLGIGASPEARLLYRVAPAILALSAALWRWHPWEVSQKWSLYLHALSAVLALRILADVLAWMEARERSAGRRARLAGAAVTALLLVGLSLHAAVHQRSRWNDLTAALQHLEGLPLAPGSVAVEVHPYPTLRYLCEAGPFVGRLPYPAAFRLPSFGGPRPLVAIPRPAISSATNAPTPWRECTRLRLPNGSVVGQVPLRVSCRLPVGDGSAEELAGLLRARRLVRDARDRLAGSRFGPARAGSRSDREASMRLGYFTMPLHPPGADPGRTLADDLEQIVTLDRLGFAEAWVGEHFTSEWENIPCPDLFIAQALARTQRIMLGHRRLLPAEPQPADAGPAHRPARPDGARALPLGHRLRRVPRRLRALRHRRQGAASSAR